MQYRCYYLLLGLIIISTISAYAQPAPSSDEIFSPTAALTFYNLAKELTYTNPDKPDISDAQAKQAMIFLFAANQLDRQADYVLEDMLLLACNDSSVMPEADLFSFTPPDANNTNTKPKDNSMLVQFLLTQYADNNANLSICRKAVGYLLGKCDTREQKETLLSSLFQQTKSKNEPLASDIASQLAMLAAEKSDYETATNLYMTAINLNRYNHLAFDKLTELLGKQLQTGTYLEQLRFYLRENPLNLQMALAFAQNALHGELFQTAADAYQYCADLFSYLYPDESLPQDIYLPLALASYNTERNPHDAIQIADKIRKTGTVDIMLETVAAKAAGKTGDTQKARQILSQVEEKALLKYSENTSQQQYIAQQLGWFYCFGKTDPNKAIEWTNKAYAAEPNSPTAAALLAYAFILNNQTELAQSFVDAFAPSQILNLVKANIQIKNNQTDTAVETLRSIIASSPETIEAQQARTKLEQLNAEYIPQTDPAVTRTLLESTFKQNVVPVFVSPEQMIEYQLKIQGDKFYYGKDLKASFVITNRSKDDIIISDSSIVQGNIRIDVAVAGDLNTKIPALISKNIQPTQHIATNSSLLIPLQLSTGKLKNILTRYPQANLQITLTAYLDPVTLADGSVDNRLSDIKPYTKTIERPALELSPQFLRNRMNSLKRRMQSHATAELFAGLLIEENIMANQQPMYKFMYADWMGEILKSGLVYNITTDNWPSRVYTMSSMLDLPLDFELMQAVSENLNAQQWPTRMMALYLLDKNNSDGFSKVLDYTAQYDTNKIVRSMAIALGGKIPQKQP